MEVVYSKEKRHVLLDFSDRKFFKAQAKNLVRIIIETACGIRQQEPDRDIADDSRLSRWLCQGQEAVQWTPANRAWQ